MSASIEVGGLQFELRLSPRRRTLAVTVDRGGELVAHAPVSVDLDEVREFVRSRLLWVHRKLNLKRELVRQQPAPAWLTGQGIYYMGKSYRLRLVEDAKAPLDLRTGWWELRRPDQEEAVAHFRRWFITNGAAWTADRVSGFARRLNVEPLETRVRDLGSRWGSCTAAGRVLINWKLLQLPVDLIDYVILHETAHLKNRTHDAAFWSTLDRNMPDATRRRERLRSEAWQYMQFGVASIAAAPTRKALTGRSSEA
jgi:predicted metal-dependent hydrolase